MTGPEHFREAEALLMGADEVDLAEDGQQEYARLLIATAQVHATLALAAATALNVPHPEGGFTVPDWEAWVDTASAFKLSAIARGHGR